MHSNVWIANMDLTVDRVISLLDIILSVFDIGIILYFFYQRHREKKTITSPPNVVRIVIPETSSLSTPVNKTKRIFRISSKKYKGSLNVKSNKASSL